MPFQYKRDDDKHRVVFTFQGPFQEAKSFAVLERERVEDEVMAHSTISAESGGVPRSRKSRLFVNKEESSTAPIQGPQRVVYALLTNDTRMYHMACVYAAMARARRKIAAFCERSDADASLATQSNDFYAVI